MIDVLSHLLQPVDFPEGVKPPHFCEVNTRTRKSEPAIKTFPKSSRECPNERIADVKDQMLELYTEVSLKPSEIREYYLGSVEV